MSTTSNNVSASASQRARREVQNRFALSMVVGLASGGILANLFPSGAGCHFEGNPFMAYGLSTAAAFILPIAVDLCNRRAPGWKKTIFGLLGAAIGACTAFASLLIDK